MKYKKLQIKEADDVIPRGRLLDAAVVGDMFDEQIQQIQVRDDAEFAGVGFYLSGDFNWVIGEDSQGVLVLIPLEKGE